MHTYYNTQLSPNTADKKPTDPGPEIEAVPEGISGIARCTCEKTESTRITEIKANLVGRNEGEFVSYHTC